jgi:hypothetical protein
MMPVCLTGNDPEVLCRNVTAAVGKLTAAGNVVDYYGFSVAYDNGTWMVTVPFRAGGKVKGAKVQYSTDPAKYWAGNGGIIAHAKPGFTFLINGQKHFFGIK